MWSFGPVRLAACSSRHRPTQPEASLKHADRSFVSCVRAFSRASAMAAFERLRAARTQIASRRVNALAVSAMVAIHRAPMRAATAVRRVIDLVLLGSTFETVATD